MADGIPVRTITSRDGGVTWIPSVMLSHTLLTAVADSDGLAPIAIQALDAEIRLITHIAPASNLTLTDEVPIDGHATVQVTTSKEPPDENPIDHPGRQRAAASLGQHLRRLQRGPDCQRPDRAQRLHTEPVRWGVIDHGKISAKDLKPDNPTVIGNHTLILAVNCDAPIKFALHSIDNRASSSIGSNYGLGFINDTQKLGDTTSRWPIHWQRMV